jgi:DNA invertase Pin-like site-specific DNA recombinase
LKLFDDLRAAGVGLVSLKDAIDLETSTGRLVCHILASVAHFELELRRERQAAGISAARAAGKRWGGSLPGRRRISKEQEQLIHRMRAEGAKVAAISRATRVSRPTIYAILTAV